MKKLLLLLQITALVAICPAYVALEMTHAAKRISEKPAGSIITTKTENVNTQVSEASKNKIQSNTLDLLTK